MIIELLTYFAKFPQRSGVMANFSNGASILPHYRILKEQLSSLPDVSLLPEITDYVFAVDIDTVKDRIDKTTGTYLFVDFGDLVSARSSRNSIEDSLSMAVTIACKVPDSADYIERIIYTDSTLQLINDLRARVYADKSHTPWMNELSDDHTIAPFVNAKLQSIGWTILFRIEGADLLNLKGLTRKYIIGQ